MSVTGVLATVRGRLLIFALLQVAAAAAFFGLMATGHAKFAIAALVVPLQLGLFVYLSQSENLVMGYLVTLLPASMLGLLPQVYMYAAVYAGPLLLLLMVSTQADSRRTGGGPRLSEARGFGRYGQAAETLPIIVLAVLLAAAASNAYLKGWASTDLMRYCAMGGLFLAAVALFGTKPATALVVRRLLDSMTLSYVLVVLVFFLLRGPAAFLGGKALETTHGIANLNAVAAHSAAASAYLLVRAVLERGWSMRVVRLLLMGVPLLVLVLSRSRGAWLGFGAALIYVVLLTRSFWLILSGAVTAAGLIASDVLKFAVLSRVEATSVDDPALLGRLLLWHSAITVGLDNWLTGVGFLNFRHVKYYYGFPLPRAIGLPFNTHNLYLEFFAGLGLLGLAAFLWLLIRGIRGAHGARKGRDGSYRPEAVGMTAMLVSIAVHGLLDAVIWQHGMLVLLGVLLGLAGSIRRLNLREARGVE